MFSNKNKIDYNLKYYMSKNIYKYYRIIIKYKAFQSSIVKKINSYKGTVYNIIESSNLISAQLNLKGINRIIEYPEVEKIFFDEYLFLCGMSVTSANKSSYILKTDLSGAGVGIGIIDSGVYPHKDLISPTNKIALFVDVINGIHYPYDDNGHGTSISGILCSSGFSSNNMYKGICHKSRLFCYKAFDKLGKGFASDILFSIESLINISKEHNIKILCLPFELLSHNILIVNEFENLFNLAIKNGMIPIIPAGSSINEKYSIMGIASLSNCITVGGLDSEKSTVKPYFYSACGPLTKYNKPDLCASCTNIVSLNSDKNYISEKNGMKLYPKPLDISYKTFIGSSLAAAYVCGICSLIFEKKPDITFKDISSLLQVICDPIDDIPKYFQGNGVINLKKFQF